MAKKKSKKKPKSSLYAVYDIPQHIAVTIIVAGFVAWVFALNYMSDTGTNLLAML